MQVKQQYSAAFFSYYLFLSLYIKPALNFKTPPPVFYEKVPVYGAEV